MEVHADRVLNHLGGARLGIGRLLVLRLDPLLHVVLAQDLDAQGLQDLEVALGLNLVNDVLRKNLVELLVGDVAAVRLTAALHLVDHVVELGLAEDRHALHRRQHRLDVRARVLLGAEARQRRDGQVRVALVVDVLGVLVALDLRRQLVGVERLGLEFGVVVGRQVIVAVEVPPPPAARLGQRLLGRQVVVFRDHGQLEIVFLDNVFIQDLRRRLLAQRLLRRLLRRLRGRLPAAGLRGLLRRFRYLGHISPVYNPPNLTLSSVG